MQPSDSFVFFPPYHDDFLLLFFFVASRSSLKPLVEQRRHSDPLTSKATRVSHRELAVELAKVAAGANVNEGDRTRAATAAPRLTSEEVAVGTNKSPWTGRPRSASVDSGSRHSAKDSMSRAESMASLSALGANDKAPPTEGDRRRRRPRRSSLSARVGLAVAADGTEGDDEAKGRSDDDGGGDDDHVVVDLEIIRSGEEFPEPM